MSTALSKKDLKRFRTLVERKLDAMGVQNSCEEKLVKQYRLVGRDGKQLTDENGKPKTIDRYQLLNRQKALRNHILSLGKTAILQFLSQETKKPGDEK